MDNSFVLLKKPASQCNWFDQIQQKWEVTAALAKLAISIGQIIWQFLLSPLLWHMKEDQNIKKLEISSFKGEWKNKVCKPFWNYNNSDLTFFSKQIYSNVEHPLHGNALIERGKQSWRINSHYVLFSQKQQLQQLFLFALPANGNGKPCVRQFTTTNSSNKT